MWENPPPFSFSNYKGMNTDAHITPSHIPWDNYNVSSYKGSLTKKKSNRKHFKVPLDTCIDDDF
jgi:hypothetical protein